MSLHYIMCLYMCRSPICYCNLGDENVLPSVTLSFILNLCNLLVCVLCFAVFVNAGKRKDSCRTKTNMHMHLFVHVTFSDGKYTSLRHLLIGVAGK